MSGHVTYSRSEATWLGSREIDARNLDWSLHEDIPECSGELWVDDVFGSCRLGHYAMSCELCLDLCSVSVRRWGSADQKDDSLMLKVAAAGVQKAR